VLTDGELRVRLARDGRALAESRYGWPALLEKFVALVEEVGSARSRAAAGAPLGARP
jgi:hypothetical protein